MKPELRVRPGDDVRALWLIACCLLIGGSFYVHMRYGTAISASHARTETFYRETVAAQRIIREAAGLRMIQRRAERDLARVSHDTSLSGTTASLLEALHSSANRFDARVLAVQPEGAPSSAGKNAAGADAALQAISLTIRVRAKFRDVLGFVENLSHHATLVNVSDTEMSLAAGGDPGAAEPQLDATIHATLYRLEMPGGRKIHLARAR